MKRVVFLSSLLISGAILMSGVIIASGDGDIIDFVFLFGFVLFMVAFFSLAFEKKE